jgi:phospholipid-binding lipoprotein MlaA
MALLPCDENCQLLKYAAGYGYKEQDIQSGAIQVASADDSGLIVAAEDESAEEEAPWEKEEKEIGEGSSDTISDPLEPLNRAFFAFNDKFYFWLVKPISQGYRTVVPKPARSGVRNFFTNLKFPIRFINCLLQGKGEEAGYEFVSFFINSTVGLGGFLNVAGDSSMNLEYYDEDLGQTLGSYGMGPSVFICWPIIGPSSVRDTIGLVGDSFLDPVNYLVPRTKYNIAVKSYNRINETSFTIGDYEDLKKSALDPYVAVRDAYYQHRKQKIKE